MGNQEKKATKKKFVSQPDTDDQPLLSVKQVAALLNIHPEVVRRHIRSGDLQAVKVGKLFRISRDNVKKWQKDQGKPEEFTQNQLTPIERPNLFGKRYHLIMQDMERTKTDVALDHHKN